MGALPATHQQVAIWKTLEWYFTYLLFSSFYGMLSLFHYSSEIPQTIVFTSLLKTTWTWRIPPRNVSGNGPKQLYSRARACQCRWRHGSQLIWSHTIHNTGLWARGRGESGLCCGYICLSQLHCDTFHVGGIKCTSTHLSSPRFSTVIILCRLTSLTMVSIAKLTLVRLIHSIETVERKLLKSHLVFFYPQHPFVFTIYISHNGSSEAT